MYDFHPALGVERWHFWPFRPPVNNDVSRAQLVSMLGRIVLNNTLKTERLRRAAVTKEDFLFEGRGERLDL
jgi:hypothetical protein